MSVFKKNSEPVLALLEVLNDEKPESQASGMDSPSHEDRQLTFSPVVLCCLPLSKGGPLLVVNQCCQPAK